MARIVADTICGLSREAADPLDIPIIPQIIHFGNESFREGVDLDHAAFMGRLRAGKELPKTAAPYPGDFLQVFEPIVRAGESIVCIHPSSEVSGTVRSALTARESFPDADIRIIDTRTIAGPLASMVLAAGQQAKAGASADQIEALVLEMMPRARIYFLVDTLEFLQRGGRIGGASALLGTILQIKPILTFKDGHVDQFEKERTKKRALARIRELVRTEAAQGDDAHLTIMHTGASAEAVELAAELQTGLGGATSMIMNLVPVIVAHTGPGALAVGFFTPAVAQDKAGRS
jgi:DegV family protein with EDD domain